LRSFPGFELNQCTPDHSTISRTRRLIDLETHRKVFLRVLGILAEEGLLKGNTVAIAGTTLEANAALRTIVRRDTGEGYDEFLKGLAKESVIETPTREQLAKLDRKRKKKGNNDDWKNPYDPDAQITKMKKLCPHGRNRGHAKSSPAGSWQHDQAIAHSCLCVQSEPGHEESVGTRNPSGIPGQQERPSELSSDAYSVPRWRTATAKISDSNSNVEGRCNPFSITPRLTSISALRFWNSVPPRADKAVCPE
jgi:hypothetical protein